MRSTENKRTETTEALENHNGNTHTDTVTIESIVSKLDSLRESLSEYNMERIQYLSKKLKTIKTQIEEYQKQVNIKQKITQHKINEITTKLIAMEFEAVQLKAKLEMAKNKALRDTVTFLPNRLAYENRLAAEIARHERYQSPLSLIIIDIDHFKKINDTYGHYAGDNALLLIGRLLSRHCRKTDFICRYGGEEFAMLLPETNSEPALYLANQIRIAIQNAGFNSNGQIINLTISCGISQFNPSDSENSFFERADKALYQAKKEGRNRCIMY